MSLQAILDNILAAGEGKVDEIDMRAYTQMHAILAEARSDAQQIKEEAYASAAAPAAHERARILHHARLEALRTVGNVREALVDAALEQTRGRLGSMRNDTAYFRILRRLTQEALAELAGSFREAGQACLVADPRDRSLLEDILAETGMTVPIRYELSCWGGVVAKSEDGRVIVINTLEARLERATPYLRQCLAALFEAEASKAKPDRMLAGVAAI